MAEETSRSRLDMLAVINKISQVITQKKGVHATLQKVVETINSDYIPSYFESFQISFDKKTYSASAGNDKKKFCLERSFVTDDGNIGVVQYCLPADRSGDREVKADQDYFLSTLLRMLVSVLNPLVGNGNKNGNTTKAKEKEFISGKFLHWFLNKNTYSRDIYHDLMPFKVTEVLLISSLYDAYSIEREGRFQEHMLGQYGQLNLTSIPRITGVASVQQAMSLLAKKNFDLIIYMVGVDKKAPLTASKQIKETYPHIPIFLLLNNNSDVPYFKIEQTNMPNIDKVFAWNGDANIFFSMIKLLEDQVNVENDTRVGQVRVILLAEDSPVYASRYLSFLYRVLMEQTKSIIDDVSTDELYKVLRMRARPKILFASTFEQAIEVIDKYKDNLLCLITDVKYRRDGVVDDNAGVELLDYARVELKELPVIMQSSDPSYAETAKQYNSLFIDKNSETLYEELQKFISYYLGFGDFIFKAANGDEIVRASNLREFENALKTIPDESLLFHASHNHFSMWLMARQEIKAANFISPKKVTDFSDLKELRSSLIRMIREHKEEKVSGNIIPYEDGMNIDADNFYTLSDGSLGGKGRGLAFINALIHGYDFKRELPDIKIKTPATFIIGSLEFEDFVAKNQLYTLALHEEDNRKVKQAFLDTPLSDGLKDKLRSLLQKLKKPLAVRSSGLFEDSLTRPFAGIFETYILPNNHEDDEIRFNQVCSAIKLVFASLYSGVSKSYVKAIDYKLEDERMAVVIEEVVGNKFGDYFYPHLSGVAQSYNYYPFAYMKAEEGYATAAVGLGTYVVEGNMAYRFSPKYPGVEINSPKDQLKNSQVRFHAVDLRKGELDLMEGENAGLTVQDIYLAEKHGTLKHCASVYNPDSDNIYPGLSKQGPRIVNFANILKYNYIPLAQALRLMLELGKEAMGTAVELEYAVDLNRDEDGYSTLYILQIKPLISKDSEADVDMNSIKKESLMLYTEKGMGNGINSQITDVVFVDPDKFNKSHTEEIALEIEKINENFIKENKNYILIGPGRWGTRDKWIGIPVRWPQISKAKIIVETDLHNFPLDASSGSHFFHNVVSMNVGYFTVQSKVGNAFIEYDKLNKQEIVYEGKFFRHVRFKSPLNVMMDGKKGHYLIQMT